MAASAVIHISGLDDCTLYKLCEFCDSFLFIRGLFNFVPHPWGINGTPVRAPILRPLIVGHPSLIVSSMINCPASVVQRQSVGLGIGRSGPGSKLACAIWFFP